MVRTGFPPVGTEGDGKGMGTVDNEVSPCIGPKQMGERFQASCQFHVTTAYRDDLAEGGVIHLLGQCIGYGALASGGGRLHDGYQRLFIIQPGRFEFGQRDVWILGLLGADQTECVFFQPANGMFQQTFVDMAYLLDIQCLVGK